MKEFVTSVKDSLNDRFGNRGIYTADQKTMSGNTPSEGLGTYKIGAGKAYVKGYEVETLGPTYVDVIKPQNDQRVGISGCKLRIWSNFL